MRPSQGMVSFSLMSNTPLALLHPPSRGNTPKVGQQKQRCVSGPPGLNAAFMRPGWVRSDWVTWSWSRWHTDTHTHTHTISYTHTHIKHTNDAPFSQTMTIKNSSGVEAMGLSVSLSFPAGCFVSSALLVFTKLPSNFTFGALRHCVQSHCCNSCKHGRAVNSRNDKNNFWNNMF